MLIFFTVILILIVAFLFFSHPRIRFTSPTADIETRMGRTTIYHYRSKTAKGKGVIALVHGFCENQLYFQCLAEPLTKAGYDCIAINLFGYNGSLPNADSYTVEDYAKQLVEALQELERLRMLKQLVAVWGHSMGGAAVFLASNEIVNHNPEVRGLFLENPGFGNNLSTLAKCTKPFTHLANFAGPRSLLQMSINFLFARPIKDPDGREFIRHLLTTYAPGKKIAVTNANSNFKVNFSLDGLSENAIGRLHFMISRKDKMISFKKVEQTIIKALEANPAFPRDQLLILPEKDHFLSLEAPEEVAAFALRQLEEAPDGEKDHKLSSVSAMSRRSH